MRYMFFILLISFCYNGLANSPKLLLAKSYQSDIKLEDYWVSEKLDGVRAYWNGETLISRQGYPFFAPNWFTRVLPNIPMDGELWIGRRQFSVVSGLVRRQRDNSLDWKDIQYMIFDLPKSNEIFDRRIEKMIMLTELSGASHFKAIPQFKVQSSQVLMQLLDDVVELGGEGLMLHKGASYYKSGRSNDLLKLKKYFDAEATVIKHIKGKGKYSQVLGALLVETSDRVRFKIGTGFSEEERINPPLIGDVITYKYFGLTHTGKPRFASFLRIRKKR